MPTRREFVKIAVASSIPVKPPYVVGCSPTGAPFSFIDIKADQVAGVMVEIIEAISHDAGFNIELRPVAFPALFPSLVARKIDVIASAVLKTPIRARVATFSLPLFSYGAGIVVRGAEHKLCRSVSDFENLIVGAQTGTRFLEQVQASPARDVKTYDNLSSALRDLTNDRVDLVYGDAPILRFQMTQGRFPSLNYVPSFRPPILEDVCMVMRKDEAQLAQRVNASVDRLRSGALQEILSRWHLTHE